MKINELFDQTIGAMPPTTSNIPNPNMTGSVADLNNPAMNASNLAQQQKQKQQQRKAIQDQIAALQKQLSELTRTV
jgi:hypothetical protein